MTIDILRYLSDWFGLIDITKNNIVPIKRDFITMKNITRAMY